VRFEFVDYDADEGVGGFVEGLDGKKRMVRMVSSCVTNIWGVVVAECL